MNEPHDEILDKVNDILHSNDSKIYGKEPRTLPLPSFLIYRGSTVSIPNADGFCLLAAPLEKNSWFLFLISS